MTISAPATTVTPYRAYFTRVTGIRRLSPHFIRFTLWAEDLRLFDPGGMDQRIKLFLPRPDGTVPDVGFGREPQPSMMEWYQQWRLLDEAERNPIRTYTVRDIRPEAAEIDVDFVVHGTEGPASAWALGAARGDELIVIGPDVRAEQVGGGIEWNPGTAREVLLAGDETAAPAICGILEGLAASDEAGVFFGETYIEVPTAEDILEVNAPSGVVLRWLPRDGAPLGEMLGHAVRDWGRRRQIIFEARRAAWAPGLAPVGAPAGSSGYEELGPDEQLWEVAEPDGFREYAWLAGEAGAITGLRRHLVKEIGLSKKQVSFMGYWKKGRASA